MADFIIHKTHWQTNAAELTAIRTEVFIKEQKVPEEDEWDKHDATAIHFLAFAKEHAVGTARFLHSGKLTRMAVLRAFRNQGIGSALINAVIEHAKSVKCDSIYLDAQLQAVPLYRKFGFSRYGALFIDAGIQHVKMIKKFNEDEG